MNEYLWISFYPNYRVFLKINGIKILCTKVLLWDTISRTFPWNINPCTKTYCKKSQYSRLENIRSIEYWSNSLTLLVKHDITQTYRSLYGNPSLVYTFNYWNNMLDTSCLQLLNIHRNDIHRKFKRMYIDLEIEDTTRCDLN